MSKDVRIAAPVGAPSWLDPVKRDIGAGLRTKQDETDLLNALTNVTGNGLIAKTGDATVATRTIIAPAAGITMTNGGGVAGNPTLALANDLAALEGLSANGIVTRTATDTAAVRTLAGTAAEITVANGDGVAGNPTLSLPTALTFTGKTITGGVYATIASVSIDDANFGLDITSSVPTITFDSNDVLRYDRSVNTYAFRISSTDIVTIAPTGLTAVLLAVDDANFNLDILSSLPTLTFDTNDVFRYNRSTNAWAWRIGGSDILTLTAATLTGVNAVFTGTLSCDGNATLGNASGDAHTVNGSLTSTKFIKSTGTDGYVMATGTAASGSGTGMVLHYTGSVGVLASYNFTGAAYVGMRIQGSSIILGPSDVTDWFTVDSAAVNITTEYRVDGTRVVTNRRTGWAAATGTATRTTFDTATVTLPQLAERLKALIDDLHASAGHGLIGS